MRAKTPKTSSRQKRSKIGRPFDCVMPLARAIRVFVNRRRTKIVLAQGAQGRRERRVRMRPEQVEHVCALLHQAAGHVAV